MKFLTRNKIMNKTYRTTLFILVITGLSLFSGCSRTAEKTDGITVAVTVLPQEAFVKAVAGDLVHVVTMVPPGASPENYQPTPKQMTDFAEASLYFTIGMPNEATSILPGAASLNKKLVVIDLAEKVDAVYPARFFDASEDPDHAGRDPHMWMSPKRVIVMVEAIRDALSELDPTNASLYQSNAQNYITQLKSLDEALTQAFSQIENNSFIIMHPSLGYFADDYSLTMVELEQDGKASSASHMEKVIDFAKLNDIHVVFYQTEFDSNQAKTLAAEIEGTTMPLDILSSDYINNMEKILEIFKANLK